MSATRLFSFLSLVIACTTLAQTPTPAPATFPPVRSQVSVGTQQRRLGDSYQKSMEITPKVIIEGSQRMNRIPPAEATMIIAAMDTRAKYTLKQEVYQVLSAETLPVPEAKNGDRRTFSFAPSSVTFDSYRDTTNIGGLVYKYYVYGLRDPETKKIIDFQTNYPQLAAAVKAKPELRDEVLSLTRGANLPATLNK